MRGEEEEMKGKRMRMRMRERVRREKVGQPVVLCASSPPSPYHLLVPNK